MIDASDNESDEEHFPWTPSNSKVVSSQFAIYEVSNQLSLGCSSEVCSSPQWMCDVQYQSEEEEDMTCGRWSWELHGCSRDLEGQQEWSGENDTHVSLAGRKEKRVGFHENVSVHIFHEDQVATFELMLQNVHIALSRCWNAQQVSSWMLSNQLLEGYRVTQEQPETQGHRMDKMQGQTDRASSESQPDAMLDLWNTLPRYDENVLKMQTIETWFLCNARYKVCHHSRAIRIKPDMTIDDFRIACKEKWSDKIRDGNLAWYVVQNAPHATPSTTAHVILCQEPCQDKQAHLLHWDAWPILSKFRAVLMPVEVTVEQALAIAGVHRVCQRHDVICHVQCRVGAEVEHFSHHQRIRFPNSQVLYGYAAHIPPSESEEESTESMDEASASVPDTSGEEDTDEFSWVTLQGPVLSFDDQGPFPWELNDNNIDEAIELEPDEPVFTFLEEHEVDMNMHAHAIREATTEEDSQWVAITFGVGLTDLGRRDMEFRSGELAQIPNRIMAMWQDHIQNGEGQLIFVNPQPERMHRLPYLVFIVSVDYGGFGQQDMSKILVRESSFDREMIRSRPYAAAVHSYMSPRGILMQLQHDECFPSGVRDCNVKLQHQLLDVYQTYVIPQGALCDIHIDLFPEYVQEAERTVHGAEQIFKIARAMFENTVQFPIIIRAHGISPSNIPLGHRDVITSYEELPDLEWIKVARTLWPFDDQRAALIFVPDANVDIIEMGQPLILHIIVNYHTDRNKCPIMIRQRITQVEDMKKHYEWWAKALPREVHEDSIRREIHQPPFWCIEGAVTHIYREGKILRENEPDWSNGQTLDLRLNVHTRQHLLHVIMTTNKREFDTIEPDTSSWLQIKQILHTSSDEMPDMSTAPSQWFQDPIDEICMQYNKAVNEIMDQNHHHVESENLVPTDVAEDNESNQQHRHDQLSDIRTLQQILDQLQDDEWQGLNQDYEHIPNMHDAAKYAFANTDSCQEIPSCGNLHIYTDGSAGKGKAAWAFIVVLEYAQAGNISYVRMGYAAGEVTHDLGDFVADAIDAEATAIIAAGELLLKQKWAAWRHVYCHFDAKAVGFAAAGQQNLPIRKQTTSSRVENARIMISLVQQKFEKFHPCHVFAHEGHPYNEAADSFARGYREGWRPQIPAVLQSGSLWQHPLRKWAWIEMRHTTELPGLISIVTDAIRDKPNPWPDRVFARSTAEHPKAQSIMLTLATVNVGTMDYRATNQEVTLSMKATALMHQFEEADCDVVYLQETRGAHSQCLQQGSFIRIMSAANQGQGGLETWLNVRSIQKKMGIDIQDKDVTTWHQDNRTLALTVSADGIVLNLINAYGPQQGRGTEYVHQWWANFEDVLKQCPMGGPMLIAGDFNAKIGSVTSEWIGDCDPDFENDAGTQMRQMCEKMRLMIPSTFAEIHEGQSATYTNPKGFKGRLDYFLISEHCIPGVLKTQVNGNIDVLNGDWDHSVLELQLSLQVAQTKSFGWKRVANYDRSAAEQSGKSCIHNLSEQPWSRDINEHWSHLRDELQDSCQLHFPKKKRNKRQVYFSEEVWQIVCDRKDVKKQHRDQQSQLHLLMLKQCFQAWKQRDNDGACQIDLEIHSAQVQEAITYEARSSIDANFRAQKRMEWKHWALTKTEEMRMKANQAKGAAIFHAIQPKKAILRHMGHHRRATPGLRNKAGKWAFSRQAIADQWETQFAEIENARNDTMENLMQRSSPSSPKVDTAILEEIPSLYDFEHAVRSLKNGKAPGLDNIGPEILKIDPCETAKRFYPLLVKGAIRRQWVAEFGGGWILPLHKGKMAKQEMEGYRAILLEPCIARAVSKAWRPKIQAAYENLAAPGQWGGRRGLGIEALHLCLRLAQSTAKSSFLSTSSRHFIPLLNPCLAMTMPLERTSHPCVTS